MQNRSFTLIELLIVVLIIGILVTIAMTAYQKMVEKARYTEAKAVLSSVAKVNLLYFHEHGDFAGPEDSIVYDNDSHELNIEFPTDSKYW